MASSERTPIPLGRELGPDGPGEGPRKAPPLGGQTPGPGSRSVLERIARGDPLRMAERCRERLRQRALLISLRRLVARSLARTAAAARRKPAAVPIDAWLAERIDEAVEDLLREDRDRSAAAADPRYRFAAEALAVSSDLARRVCVAFNELPFCERRHYWSSFVEIDPRSRRHASTVARG